MSEASNKKLIRWIGITLAVMFILPFAVAKLASECAGMALCMMLFLVINPIYSIILGIAAVRDIKALWNLPIISAVAFLAGVWLFFDIHEPWFIAYAAIYLCIGLVAMFLSHLWKRRITKNVVTDMDCDFPFDDAPNTATSVCKHIIEQGAPIIYVSHNEDDGMWQFLCGGQHEADNAKLVSLKWVYEHDPSVATLKDMPMGCYAERKSLQDKWIICRS